MPTLPMPLGGGPLEGGVLPVTSADDVKKVQPSEVRRATIAPVRDALNLAQAEMFKAYQTAASSAAKQTSLLTASEQYLDGLGPERSGVTRQPGESDENYLARILTTPEVVTKNAIVDAINADLAPYTVTECQVFESGLDRWFVTDGSLPWHSFIGSNPTYSDRLYPEDGGARLNSMPGGAWAFGDTVGRYFVARIPALTGLDDEHAFILTGGGTFFADGSDTSGSESSGDVAGFVWADRQTSIEVYRQIVGDVEKIKGQGMRWQLLVDPRL